MQMTFSIFTPIGATANLAVTATTGSVALDNVTGTSRSVRVYNTGDVIVFLEFGVAAVEAAAATSLPLGPGAVEWFEIGQAVTHCAGITASGTATVYFSEGMGS
jgi:hypothetical protein